VARVSRLRDRFSKTETRTSRRDAARDDEINADAARRRNNRHNLRRRLGAERLESSRRLMRRWRIFLKVSTSRSAGRRFLSSHSSEPGFRCRAHTSRNEIRRSAWREHSQRWLESQVARRPGIRAGASRRQEMDSDFNRPATEMPILMSAACLDSHGRDARATTPRRRVATLPIGLAAGLSLCLARRPK